jgi:hypothetical protein
MMIVAGQTPHYVVSYDDSLSNGAALANAAAQARRHLRERHIAHPRAMMPTLRRLKPPTATR